MKNSKKVIFILLLSLLMGLEALIANKIYFPKLDIFASGTFIIILNICFWGVIFCLPRIIVWLALSLNFITAITLLLYHNYFPNPLTLSIIWYQFKEGGHFLAKTPEVFLNGKIAIVFLVTFLNFYLYAKLASKIKGTYWLSLIFIGPLLILNYLLLQGPGVSFNTVFFNDTCTYMGYRSCWMYELVVKKHTNRVLKDVFETSNSQPRIKLSLPSSNHIYVIQVESLVYDIFNQKVGDKEITPFLNQIAKEGVLFEVLQKEHGASANTDFFVSSGGYSDQEFTIIYNMYRPDDIYSHLNTLPKKAYSAGYYPRFFHNYKGSFFKREQHIPAQGYKEAYFYEDMKDKYPDDYWGVADRYLFEMVSKENRAYPKDKTLNFIVTVSLHTNFKIKDNNHPLLMQPKNIKDDYINAANYVDLALADFIKAAPEDALFLIYGDHGVEEIGSCNIPLLIFSKKEKIKIDPRQMSMLEMISMIHGLFPKQPFQP